MPRFQPAGRMLVPMHVEAEVRRLFNEICRRDREGVVAKWNYGAYMTGRRATGGPVATATRLQPRFGGAAHVAEGQNPAHSQAVDRDELFARRIVTPSVRSC